MQFEDEEMSEVYCDEIESDIDEDDHDEVDEPNEEQSDVDQDECDEDLERDETDHGDENDSEDEHYENFQCDENLKDDENYNGDETDDESLIELFSEGYVSSDEDICDNIDPHQLYSDDIPRELEEEDPNINFNWKQLGGEMKAYNSYMSLKNFIERKKLPNAQRGPEMGHD